MAEPNKGELEKLLIKAYSAADYSGEPVAEFKADFNPQEYGQVYDVEYQRQQGEGTTGSPVVFRKVKPQEYRFKLMFDGTGTCSEKVEVYDRIQEFFSVVGYDGEIHRPRYLKLLWGKLESKCVLLKADITYKLFYSDGRPLRAIMDATFSENIDDSTRAAEANDQSPDLMRKVTVKEGDTLPLLSYRIYGDQTYYLKVAEANGLNNFRNLKAGQTLVFPPLEKSANGQ